jgi:hypothetical protein
MKGLSDGDKFGISNWKLGLELCSLSKKEL